jgi:cell division protein FtsB
MPESRAGGGRVDRRLLYGALGLGVAVLLLGNRGFRRLVSNWFLLRRLNAERRALDQEEDRLKKSIAAAQSDDRALEAKARKDLGYLKPGEVEYRFPPPDPSSK